MVGSKDHTYISSDNILKPAVESLMADEQQQYEDYMRQAKEKFLSQGGSPLESYQTWRDQHRISSTSLQVPNVSKPDDIQSIK
jgi:hypothetical protein